MYIRFTLFVSALVGFFALAKPAASQTIKHPDRDDTKPRVSPNAFVEQTVGTADFSISYCRPFVKGRKIFGELQPYGKVWRSGANEATTIVIPVDVNVEGQPLPAGVYALMTIPGENEWTVIFNKQAKQWGAFKYDSSLDALRVDVKAEKAPHEEMLTYSFEDVTDSSATVVLHWAETSVPFHIAIAD